AVLYQVYVRSFADSNGDGVGDLRGVIDKLEYLEWLGIDGIWLSPVTVSPDKDWGYDVAAYRDVQPVFGSLDDLDELVSGARTRSSRTASCAISPTTMTRTCSWTSTRRSPSSVAGAVSSTRTRSSGSCSARRG